MSPILANSESLSLYLDAFANKLLAVAEHAQNKGRPLSNINASCVVREFMQNHEASVLNLDRLFMIVGRVPGDDDDSAYLVEASDDGQALTLFEETMKANSGLHDAEREFELFIGGQSSLEVALNGRLTG